MTSGIKKTKPLYHFALPGRPNHPAKARPAEAGQRVGFNGKARTFAKCQIYSGIAQLNQLFFIVSVGNSVTG